MQVRTGSNGWPGVFIPGDEALGLSHTMHKIASSLDEGTIKASDVAAFLHRQADSLAKCKVETR